MWLAPPLGMETTLWVKFSMNHKNCPRAKFYGENFNPWLSAFVLIWCPCRHNYFHNIYYYKLFKQDISTISICTQLILIWEYRKYLEKNLIIFLLIFGCFTYISLFHWPVQLAKSKNSTFIFRGLHNLVHWLKFMTKKVIYDLIWKYYFFYA